tara:strand:- start:53 stop:403 length:351 start_codon:yes stop_codon:yes gene_type:complete
MKALIQNGKVIETSETEFEVHSSYTWVDATSDTEVGGTYVDGVFGPKDTSTSAERLALQWEYIRSQRMKKLRESDWTQNRDVTLSNDAAWVTYRQALRDLTTQSDPYNITWPTEPS